MASLPNAQTKTNFDSPSDDPSAAQAEFASNVDLFNEARQYLADLFGTDGTAATARTGLGLGNTAVLNIGDGLESNAGTLRAKLDGTTLARSSNGLKIADRGVDLTQMALGNIGELASYTTGGVPARLAPGTSGNFLKSNGVGAALTWASVTTQALKRVTSYTSAGSFTWTRDSDVNFVIVLIVGGGGGGCPSPSSASGGGGGAVLIAAAVSGNVSVTVGAGAAGAFYPNSAGAGGTSSFGSLAAAVGGQGGNQSLLDGAGGVPVLTSNAAILAAAPGNQGFGDWGGGFNPNQGVSGFFQGKRAAAGNNGEGYGGGGWGTGGGTGSQAGSGSAGCVIVYEFR